MSDTSRIPIPSFLRDGLSLNVEMRAASKKRGSHLDTASGDVLGNRSHIPFKCANRRLAMMVLRVTVAKLIWNYDICLKSVEQAEPIFDHKTLSAGRLEVRLKRMERK